MFLLKKLYILYLVWLGWPVPLFAEQLGEKAFISHSGANILSSNLKLLRREKRASIARFNSLLVRGYPPTKRQQENLEHEHNHYRQLVPATDMQYMRWDASLARDAQRHADTCDFRHSAGRRGVGENIWAAPYSNYEDAVRLWFEEVYIPSCHCQSVYKHCCGHYTQVVWAKSNRVGCGFARCRNIIAAHGHSYILVCQYKPGGNVVVMRRGRTYPVPAFTWQNATHGACSRCPRPLNQCWNGLCH